MSVEGHVVWLACGLWMGMAAAADEQPAPEVEFLEYLGTWEESDEEWLLHDIEAMAETAETAETDERSDPAPEGEESTENNDES